MGKITVERNAGGIEGLTILQPLVFTDQRGYFMETYNQKDYEAAGITCKFVQDNQSASTMGVLRGLHYQLNYPQDKLVRVVQGEVYDVVVDIREGSPTFGKWFGVELSEYNKKAFFVPKGFAHGFIVRSETAVFAYKVSDFYHPDDQDGIMWNDPDLNIDWPLAAVNEVILSDKDQKNQSFKEYCESKGIHV